MDQLRDFADDRLIKGCLFCGGRAETRDHVPSKTFLERPYPENLPVIGACRDCNESFSKDEQYVACLIESVLAGSTEPAKMRRYSVSKTLERMPALRKRIQDGCSEKEGQLRFAVEQDRIVNVMMKLARGHSAFELSQPCREDASGFWCGPLQSLSEENRDLFESPHLQQMYGEVGCRGMQRLAVVQVALQPLEGGDSISHGFIMNDWIEVQESNYRFQAIHDQSQIVIRIVIAEYLACEVVWDA